MCDLNFADAINAFSGGELLVSGPKATAGIFSTYPADYLSLWGGVVDQVGSYCHRSDTTKKHSRGFFICVHTICAVYDVLFTDISLICNTILTDI